MRSSTHGNNVYTPLSVRREEVCFECTVYNEHGLHCWVRYTTLLTEVALFDYSRAHTHTTLPPVSDLDTAHTTNQTAGDRETHTSARPRSRRWRCWVRWWGRCSRSNAGLSWRHHRLRWIRGHRRRVCVLRQSSQIVWGANNGQSSMFALLAFSVQTKTCLHEARSLNAYGVRSPWCMPFTGRRVLKWWRRFATKVGAPERLGVKNSPGRRRGWPLDISAMESLELTMKPLDQTISSWMIGGG